MYIADQARLTPHKPAMIAAESGKVLTFKELDDRSNQFARHLYAQGLRRGDHVAILMENNLRFHEVVWAALRSGLYLTTVNRYLPPDDAAYIVGDCAAKAIFSSYDRREIVDGLLPLIPNCPIRLMVDGVAPGWATRTPSRTSPLSRSKSSGWAIRCCIRPAPLAGQRASSARCRSVRSTRASTCARY